MTRSKHAVVAAELDTPFDPVDPYSHAGERIPTSKHALPSERRLKLVQVYAATMGISWPLYPG